MSRVDINLLYQIRNQYKRLDQITWTIRDAQQRFPLTTPNNEEQLIKIYFSLNNDVEDILLELKELRKQYDESTKNTDNNR